MNTGNKAPTLPSDIISIINAIKPIIISIGSKIKVSILYIFIPNIAILSGLQDGLFLCKKPYNFGKYCRALALHVREKYLAYHIAKGS